MKLIAHARSRQAGFSLIELLIALAMLTVGMAGIAIMVTSAIVTNYRNRTDTTATMMAQRVLSEISAATVNGTAPAITDCAPQNWPIATSAGGADLAASATAPAGVADIDWSQDYSGIAGDYKMKFQTCSGTVYEVRWNINAISTYANQVSVGARPLAALNATQGLKQLQYGTPVTLRSIVGQ